MVALELVGVRLIIPCMRKSSKVPAVVLHVLRSFQCPRNGHTATRLDGDQVQVEQCVNVGAQQNSVRRGVVRFLRVRYEMSGLKKRRDC